MVNSLNPGPRLFWTTVAGPILVQRWRVQLGEVVAFVSSFYLALLGTAVPLVVFFDGLRHLWG